MTDNLTVTDTVCWDTVLYTALEKNCGWHHDKCKRYAEHMILEAQLGVQLILVRFEAAGRLRRVKSSGIRRTFSQAKNIPDVISLGLGEPDISPSPHVLEAVREALDAGKTHYTQTTGMPELLEALGKKAKKDYNLTHDPNTEMLITVGGTSNFPSHASIDQPRRRGASLIQALSAMNRVRMLQMALLFPRLWLKTRVST